MTASAPLPGPTPRVLSTAAEDIELWRAVHAPWSAMGLDLFAWNPRELIALVMAEGDKRALAWFGNIPQLHGVSIWTAPNFRRGFVSLRQGGQEVLALDLVPNLRAVAQEVGG